MTARARLHVIRFRPGAQRRKRRLIRERSLERAARMAVRKAVAR